MSPRRRRAAGAGRRASEASAGADEADSPEDLLEASGLLALLDVLRVLEVAAALDLRRGGLGVRAARRRRETRDSDAARRDQACHAAERKPARRAGAGGKRSRR